MVVLFHLVVKLQPFGYDGSQVAMLQSGVDIFFVISGFIMIYVSRRGERSAGRFLAHRIIRIVPLYWLLTLATYAFTAANQRPLGDLLLSLAFLPSGAPPLFQPLIGPGWTLNLEMYFYGVFAFSLAITRTEQHLFAVVVALLISVIVASMWLPGRYWPFYGNEIVAEFAIGMTLARLGDQLKAINPATAWGMILVSGALIIAQPFASLGSRLLANGLPAGLLVAAALALEKSGRRIAAPAALILGAISYALYLSHELVITAVTTLVVRLNPDSAPSLVVAAYAMTLMVAILVAWLIYVAFERPVTGFLKRSFDGKAHG